MFKGQNFKYLKITVKHCLPLPSRPPPCGIHHSLLLGLLLSYASFLQMEAAELLSLTEVDCPALLPVLLPSGAVWLSSGLLLLKYHFLCLAEASCFW